MSVQLKLAHLDDLLLRQQSAHKVERRSDRGDVVKSVEWRFDPESCKQDEDLRKVDSEGKHIKLGTYSVYITTGLKNLVIWKKGVVTHVDFRNSSLRNQLRIRYQKQVNLAKEDEKPRLKWQDNGAPQYIPPNTWTGVSVGNDQRAIVDEMPT